MQEQEKKVQKEEKSYIKLDSVSKSYKQGTTTIPVLNDISVIFEKGVSYAISGASGSGKSTLLHIIATLDAPSEGKASYYSFIASNDLPVSPDPIYLRYDTRGEHGLGLIRTHMVGLMFQTAHLIAELSAEENVIVPGLIAGKSYEESITRARELLTHLGLQDRMTYKPSQLSGGQQQRVALARALFNKPEFIIADEPTGSLDPHTGQHIIDLLLACQQEWGMGIIVSSHDQYVTNRMQVRYELTNGQLILKS